MRQTAKGARFLRGIPKVKLLGMLKFEMPTGYYFNKRVTFHNVIN